MLSEMLYHTGQTNTFFIEKISTSILKQGKSINMIQSATVQSHFSVIFEWLGMFKSK